MASGIPRPLGRDLLVVARASTPGDPAALIGEKLFEGLLQAIAVVVIGWLVVYRQWRQLTQGRSDQVVFSANLLTPIDGAAESG